MPEAVKTLLSLSLSGSLLILILLAARPLLRSFGKRWQYYLWLLVVARLLIPWTPEASLVGGLFRHLDSGSALREALVEEVDPPPAEVAPTPPAEDDTARLPADRPDESASLPADPAPPQDVAASASSGIVAWLWLLWPAGALLLLVYKVATYRSFVRYVRAGGIPVSDPALLDRFTGLCEEAGVRRPVELSLNSLIASPLLLGVRRPCVVLPETGWGQSSLDYIVLHEMTHFRRRDLLYKWLVQLALCVHWFNPLVHLMVREVNRACELACDEAVLVLVGEERHRAYGDTLLDTLRVPGTYRESVAALTLSESASQLKERLDAIMNYRRHPHWKAAASAAMTFALFAFAAFSGAYYVTAAQPPTGETRTQHREETASRAETAGYTRSVSSYAGETLNDADRRGIDIMQYSGTWGETFEAVLPHMTNRGIDIAIGIYNDKHPMQRVKPSDYYNEPAAPAPSEAADGSRTVTLSAAAVTDVDIDVTLGAVRIEPGDSFQLYFAPKVQQYMNHRVENGVLRVRDTYKGYNQSVGDWKDADYAIVLTLPRDKRSLGNISIQNMAGSIDVRDFSAANFQAGGMIRGTISGISATGMTLTPSVGEVSVNTCRISGAFSFRGEVSSLSINSLAANSLDIFTEVGSVDAAGVSVGGPTTLRTQVGTVDLSGSLRGDIRLINSDTGNIRLKVDHPRREYAVTATNPNRAGDTYMQPLFTLNGQSYRYDYSDSAAAPYKLTIDSSNSFGDMVNITFAL